MKRNISKKFCLFFILLGITTVISFIKFLDQDNESRLCAEYLIVSSKTEIVDFKLVGENAEETVRITQGRRNLESVETSCKYKSEVVEIVEDVQRQINKDEIITFAWDSGVAAPEVTITLIEGNKLIIIFDHDYKIHRDLESVYPLGHANYIYTHFSRNETNSLNGEGFPEKEVDFLDYIGVNDHNFNYFLIDPFNVDYSEYSTLRNLIRDYVGETKSGWKLVHDYQSYFHQLGPSTTQYNPNHNRKYVHDDGREVIYSGNSGTIVSDSINMATYNYSPSNGLNTIETHLHFILDVYPYLIWGNNNEDMEERTVRERMVWDNDSQVGIFELGFSDTTKDDSLRRLTGIELTGPITDRRPIKTGATYNENWTNNTPELIQNAVLYSNTQKVIKLNGEAITTIEAGTIYIDLGATPNEAVTKIGKVNVKVPGTYYVQYYLDDFPYPSVTVTREVNVVDTTPPIFDTIVNQTIGIGVSDIDWATYITNEVDNSNGNLLKIEVEDHVDYNKEGRYFVTVELIDSSGNKTTQTFYVTVKDMGVLTGNK